MRTVLSARAGVSWEKAVSVRCADELQKFFASDKVGKWAMEELVHYRDAERDSTGQLTDQGIHDRSEACLNFQAAWNGNAEEKSVEDHPAVRRKLLEESSYAPVNRYLYGVLKTKDKPYHVETVIRVVDILARAAQLSPAETLRIVRDTRLEGTGSTDETSSVLESMQRSFALMAVRTKRGASSSIDSGGSVGKNTGGPSGKESTSPATWKSPETSDSRQPRNKADKPPLGHVTAPRTLANMRVTGKVLLGGDDAKALFGPDGSIFALCKDGDVDCHLTAFAPDGKEKWRLSFDGRFVYEPFQGLACVACVGYDGAVYLGIKGAEESPNLVAVDAKGKKSWQIQAAHLSEITVDHSGNAYVYHRNGNDCSIEAVAPGGKVKWRFKLNDPEGGLAWPTVGPDATIYVASRDSAGFFLSLGHH